MAGGRPKKAIDYELVSKLAMIQCTQEEIAGIMDISTRTLQRDDEFCRIYSAKKQAGRASLRRMQWKTAEAGIPSMLIFLGKNWLGQSDKHDVALSGHVSVKLVDDIPQGEADGD